MQALSAQGAAQDLLKVGAVDAEIGGAEPGAVGASLTHRMRGDTAAVAPVAIDQLRWLGGHGAERRHQAQPVQLPRGIGGKRHGRADLCQDLGLLVDLGAQPALA